MDWKTFLFQFKVLTRRNILLKTRNFYHLISVLILAVATIFYILYQYNQPYNQPEAEIVVVSDFPLPGITNKFRLCVAPREIKESFLNSIQASLSSYREKKLVHIKKFKDEKHLNERLLKKRRFNGTDCDAGIIIVGNISTDGSYIVRVKEDRCPPDTAKNCFIGILSNIQQAVDIAFLQEWSGNSNFKLPPTKLHGLVDVHEAARSRMYRFLRFLLVILFFPMMMMVTDNAMHEKTMKIKESMLLMGMKPFLNWSAWLYCEIATIMFVMIHVTVALAIAIVSPCKATLHFFLWFGLGCNLMVITKTITRFCTRLRVANLFATLILVVPVLNIFNPGESHRDHRFIDSLAMLNPSCAYMKGFNKIMREHDFYGAVTTVRLILIDLLIYSTLDLIAEHLFPYGIPLPWEKPKPYQKFKRILNGKNSEPKKCEDVQTNEEFIGSSPTNMDPWIKLEKIRKTYYCSALREIGVLDGVTFSIFKGEVTCLMGSNGAGKSTLMKIISRIQVPDEGNITTATSLNLGVCPAQNILYDDLSTYEHLQLFGSLKGIPERKLHSTVTKLLESFNLLNETDTRIKELSGGQKRKLCVAIAMIGDPEVLLLDEPSRMMNTQSRRKLWNLLQDYTKSGHSVVFTTHDMDEAELFSDRIALLNYGRLEYYGTTMDIKKQFGGGYNVRINLPSKKSLLCHSELVNFISDLPSKPEVILTSDKKLIVKLHSFDAAHCTEFFDKMEEQYKDIGFDCFTISVSALEEIFLLLAEKRSKHISEEKKTESQNEITIPKFTNNSSIWPKINELIRARCHIIKRTASAAFAIIFPIVILFWRILLIYLFKRIACIGPKSFKNEIIEVVNASGKPLTDFENSFLKLGMKLELINSSCSIGEENLLTEIQSHEFLNESLVVNWTWTASLRNPYSLPAMQNLMSNILWKTFMYHDQRGRELKISVQPITIYEEKFSSFLSETPVTLLHISSCLIYVALILGLEVLKEKEKNIIWLISRTRNCALPYWISTFAVHLALLSISFLVIQCLLLIFGDEIFQEFSLWIGFYLSLPGCLLSVYFKGLTIQSYKSSETRLVFLVICATSGAYLIFQVAALLHTPYLGIFNILTLFTFPIYAPFGLIFLLFEGETVDSVIHGLQWKIVCYLVIPLSFSLNAYFILCVLNSQFRQLKEKIQVMNQEDGDKEHDSKSIMDLKSVRKVYTSKQCRKTKETVAIKDLNMSFLEGQIYALMGSGTENSILMSLLSLNDELTSGKITIRDKYKESIAYCPEGNTVWPHLTVEENLRLFAVLNGIPSKYADTVAESVMKDLNLKHYAKDCAGFLSKVCQRKLSVALSLLGNSNLVLLDEPTTGMDPISKHRLWKKLHEEFPGTSERTLVVTTKSSNEAEVNCTSIGLFLDGNLRCLGPSKAFKTEFSKGFELTVKLKNGYNRKFNDFLVSEIPEVLEKSHRGKTLQYFIPTQAFKSMSELFKVVEKIQAYEDVQDCLISECTLNQIILEILSKPIAQIKRNDKYADIYKV